MLMIKGTRRGLRFSLGEVDVMAFIQDKNVNENLMTKMSYIKAIKRIHAKERSV